MNDISNGGFVIHKASPKLYSYLSSDCSLMYLLLYFRINKRVLKHKDMYLFFTVGFKNCGLKHVCHPSHMLALTSLKHIIESNKKERHQSCHH